MGNRLRSLKGFSQRLNALERFRSNKLGNGGGSWGQLRIVNSSPLTASTILLMSASTSIPKESPQASIPL